jgi:lysophospholipase L1-like esterase
MKKVCQPQALEETAARRSHVLRPTPPTKPSALKRLKALAASVPRETDLVLIGDSLAAAWPGELLRAAVPGKQIFNFGLPGDRIQNTLWRLATINLGHLKPQQTIVLVGTNNLGDGDAPEAVAIGVMTVVSMVRQLAADGEVIVVTIPRRGPPAGFREHERLHLNCLITAAAAKMERTSVVDVDRVFGMVDSYFSSLNPTDLLHLSYEGYRRLTAAIAAGRPF